MIVRKIREEEYARTCQVFAIAFEFPMAENATTPKRLEEIKRNPMTREEKYYLERWAAFDDQNNMMGFLIGFPAKVRFDGKEAVCTCISGVSSLPQYRRKGVIANCFRKHLEDSYKKGYGFSYLYPFSTVFYRQFGYELCVENVVWDIDIKTIPYFPEAKGSAVLNEQKSVRHEIKQVYEAFMRNCNLTFVREDCDWNRIICDQPAKEGKYSYVWKNEGGIPKGALSFRKEEGIMHCDAFYYTDEEGLKGLMNHIRSVRSHFGRVRISVPKHVALQEVLPEASAGGFSREMHFSGMGRVIHAENVLRMARYQGSGQVSFRLHDDYIAENNRVFHVTFEDDRCVALDEEVSSDTKDLDIRRFSRWILGCGSEEEIQDQKWKTIFYPKKNYICDGF